MDDILASASLLAGQVIAVRGKLSHEWRMMLDYSCSPICCRHEKRTLALIPEHRVGLAALVLNDPARPGVFDCVDDETASCCPVAPVPEQVIAVGRLRQVRPRGDAWMLDDPRLCSLVTRAPPPGLRATAQGCELSGRVFGPDERVVANGVMCGCHGGTRHCKAKSPGECFHAGQWHPDGTEFLRPRGSEMYSCQRGHWSRAARIPMADAQVVLRFARGSLELIESGAAGVDFVMLPVTPELRLDIRAWIDPAEGQRTRELAGERAARVHEWLLARGFAAQQLTFTLHDVPPGAPVNDVGVTVHDAL